jgi:hypothetical protein
MRVKRTTRGHLGLLVGLAAAVLCLIAALAGTPATGQGRKDAKPPTFTPTERIDVEQAVDFPYDI